MMPHIPEQAPVFMDYREMCPQAIGPTYYEADDAPSPLRTPRKCGPERRDYACKNLGALERPDVLAPAIRIARCWEADATHVHAVGEFLRRQRPPKSSSVGGIVVDRCDGRRRSGGW